LAVCEKSVDAMSDTLRRSALECLIDTGTRCAHARMEKCFEGRVMERVVQDGTTSVQRQLAQHYCSACEPARPGCPDEVLGVSDDETEGGALVFARFLSDTLVTDIDSKCAASLPRSGGEACAEAFGDCLLVTLRAHGIEEQAPQRQ